MKALMKKIIFKKNDLNLFDIPKKKKEIIMIRIYLKDFMLQYMLKINKRMMKYIEKGKKLYNLKLLLIYLDLFINYKYIFII